MNNLFSFDLHVGIGKDDTIFAKIDGKVAFERKGRHQRQISVYPLAGAAV